jgi:SpoIID/LytB domain protein
LSQYGAKGFAENGHGYKTILAHYFQGTTVGTVGVKTMKVAIQKTNAPRSVWSLRTDFAQGLLFDGNNTQRLTLAQGTSYSLRASGPNVQVTRQDGTDMGTFPGPVRVQTAGGSLVTVQQASGPWDWEEMVYRGSIFLESTGAALRAYNLVVMEDYLKGVVPREMPSSWHAEALKAQAVSARSYAYATTASFVYCTTSSQVYAGYGHYDGGVFEKNEEPGSDAAVAATANQVVKHGSTVVRTYFHSTSGGHTENIENVWRSTSTPSSTHPYYRGVDDPYEAGAGSKYHVWPDEPAFNATALRAKLLARGLPVPGTIVDVDVTKRGVSGRVTELVLRGAAGDDKTITDISDVRSALGLRDTWFYLFNNTTRIYGADRWETAVRISQRAFERADAVVVADGHALADALTASTLAGSIPGGAPILLTTTDALPYGVFAEIERLGATKAYIVGGTGVVSAAVEAELGNVVDVERVAGADRFETARQVVRVSKELLDAEGDRLDDRVIVVNGFGYPDAVVASALAYAERTPIVLVQTDAVPATSREAIESSEASSALVVGGAGVVSDTAIGQLPIPAERIAAGLDRYDTAARFAGYLTEYEGFGWDTTYVASGVSLVDALAGGPLAGETRAPILFSHTDYAPNYTTRSLTSHGAEIDPCYLLGGPGAISPQAQEMMEAALSAGSQTSTVSGLDIPRQAVIE